MGDPLSDRVGIVEHVLCADANDADALLMQPIVAPPIMLGGQIVLRAIDFDAKPRGRAVEVEDVGAGRGCWWRKRRPDCLRRSAAQRMRSGRVAARRSKRARLRVVLSPPRRILQAPSVSAAR